MTRVSILAIVVFYNIEPVRSSTVLTLARGLAEVAPEEIRIKVLLTDNSPQLHAPPQLFPDEVYKIFPLNPGLAHAYNHGIDIATQEGYDWILTLDQDTCLPANFFRELLNAVHGIQGNLAIGSVVPQMFSGNRVISPYWFRGGSVPTWFPVGYSGVPENRTYALNSASLFRVSALREAGGYDPRFWLDASDHAMFHALAECGKKVYVAPVRVEHGLSVVGVRGAISGQRYGNMLAAESAFWDLRMSRLAGLVRNATLFGRSLRFFVRGERWLAVLSLRHVIARVFRSRGSRVLAWERGLKADGKL